ncbi:MAG TPA: non-homologous end-joining DNA ligase [Terriglobales bacterium]|nr:non-homologous end-joining DNA ligase [Terriglobales bacterium]
MALEEYKRKRRFEDTPEPPPKVEKKSGHRFVVQKHDATRLHYDFRLEMDGVLKSWAVPKGPSLDPNDKRLAMQVEDHPVSYFDFEGTIPAGNYGAGAVIVWDVGKWEPLSPQPVKGKFVPGTAVEAREMLQKGDFKFRLHGERLKGDFALIHIKGRRPGSKGTEWLLIKKKDDEAVEGYDIEKYDTSVLSGKTIAQIAGDKDSAEWTSSRPASRGKVKAPWLAETLAKLDKKKRKTRTTGDTEEHRVEPNGKKPSPKTLRGDGKTSPSVTSVFSVVKSLTGAVKRPMPTAITPMLATPVEKPFDSAEWLFEIKWDGYRAVAFVENGKVRLVSRNQNDLTGQYSELQDLSKLVKAKTAILDGEIAALDEQGRASFSLMQQRTGIRSGGRRTAGRSDVPIVYYVFDLLYADGYDLRRVALEERKQALAKLVKTNELIRLSEHFPERGIALFEAAKQQGLEGILAKHRGSFYEERRSREWLKIKITQTVDCVIGGYTEPEGSRQYFGSIVLGLYNQRGQLIHVGQAGTGFTQATLKEIWQILKPLETKRPPFYGPVEAANAHWVKPTQVAEVKFTEWTHETSDGGMKLRAPVFMGLREDKDPRECTLNDQIPLLRV